MDHDPRQLSLGVDMLLPRILFGTASETRERWKATLKEAWKAGSWDDVVSRLEMAPIKDHPGYVMIDAIRGVGADPIHTEPHWWMLWVRFQRPTGSQLAATIKQEIAFLLEGMKYPWFSVGMLSVDGNRYYYTYEQALGEQEVRDSYLLPVLRVLARQMPEIVGAQRLFANGSYHHWSMGRHGWIGPFISWAIKCGLSYDPHFYRERIRDKYDDDILASLVGDGLIRKSGNDYELNE